MTEKLTPVEYFAEMIAKKDNISVYEWNYLVDKANELFKLEIMHAFNEGKITVLNKVEKSAEDYYKNIYENL